LLSLKLGSGLALVLWKETHPGRSEILLNKCTSHKQRLSTAGYQSRL